MRKMAEPKGVIDLSALLNIVKSIFVYKPHISPGADCGSPDERSVYSDNDEDQSDKTGNNNEIEWEKILDSVRSSEIKNHAKRSGENGGKGLNKADTVNKPTIVIRRRKKAKNTETEKRYTGLPGDGCAAIELIKNGMVSYSLAANIEYLKLKFYASKNQDIVLREFKIAQKIEACLVFVDGMVDTTVINQFILPQLMNAEHFVNYSQANIFDYIIKNVISIYQITRLKDYDRIIHQILICDTALFVEGCDEVLLVESRLAGRFF